MATPNDNQIRAGIRENAKLEVAKKLKVLVGKLLEEGKLPEGFEEPEPEDYLQIAEDAIGKRSVTFPGFKSDGRNYLTLAEIDTLFKAMAPEEYDKLPGSIEEMVPTDDQLEEVSGVAIRSVQKATGPMTVMGTSLFTLITSFFQAIGDLFSGAIEGGLGGFFGHVQKLAAENTGQAIGDNLDSGLSALTRENPAIGKWLTPQAIRDSVAGAKREAMVAAGVEPEGLKAADVLRQMDAGKEYKALTAAAVEAQIQLGVEKDLFEVTKGALGLDNKPSYFRLGKQALGFSPTDNDAYRITTSVTKAVTRVITDKNYRYEGPSAALKAKLITPEDISNLTKAEMSDLLRYETEKALKTGRDTRGFFEYKPTDENIAKIVELVPEYVNSNYNSLIGMNKRFQAQPNQPSQPEVAAEITTDRNKGVSEAQQTQLETALTNRINVPEVEETLRKDLETKIKRFKPDFILNADDPFIIEAKKRFAAIGAQVAAANPGLLAKGQQTTLAKAISHAMVKDDTFKTAVEKKLTEYGINGFTAGIAMNSLPDMIAPALTGVLSDTSLNTAMAGIVTNEVIRGDKVAGRGVAVESSTPAPGGAQTADASAPIESSIESMIKQGLSETDTKKLINLAALGATITDTQLDAISKASAQSIAKLLDGSETNPEKIRQTLTAGLTNVVPDPRMLGPIVDTIQQKYTAAMGKAPGEVEAADSRSIPMERVQARARAVGQVRSTIGDLVDKAVQDFGEKARAKINAQPLYVDEQKWIPGTRWLAKMIKGTQHDTMRSLVDGSVKLAMESIDTARLTQVITDSAVAATEARYSSPNGTAREFYQLSEQEKKSAIACQLHDRLQNDATYASIFPTTVGFKGVGIPLTGYKPQVISEVVDGIRAKMSFTPAPDLARSASADIKIGQLAPAGPKLGQVVAHAR